MRLNNKVRVSVLVMFLVVFAVYVFALSSVQVESPLANTIQKGNILLNATTDAHAENVSFIFIDAGTGAIVYQAIVSNDSAAPDTTFNISSFSTLLLADGVYNITINATNSTATTVSLVNNVTNVTIDNTAPELLVQNPTPVDGAKISLSSSNLTLNFSASDATSGLFNITIWVNNLLYSTCAVSPCYYNNISGDGVFSFNATAYDNAGSVNTSLTRTVTLDRTAPDTVLNLPTVGQSGVGSLTFNATVSDLTSAVSSVLFNISNSSGQVAILIATLQGSSYVNVNNTATSNFADGNFNVSVIANDTLNNKNVTSFVAFTVDNTVPSAVLNSPSSNLPNVSGSYTFNASATDATVGVDTVLFNLSQAGVQQYLLVGSLQGGDYVHVNATGGLVDGLYNVSVIVNDTVGNLNVSSLVELRIDNTAPEILIQNPSPANGSFIVPGSNLTLNFSSVDVGTGLKNISIYIDGSKVLTCVSSPCYYNHASTDGTFAFNAISFDGLGNYNISATQTVTVDNTAPSLTNFAVDDFIVNSTNQINFTATVSDANLAIDTVWLTNGSSFVALSGAGAFSVLTDANALCGLTSSGVCTVYVRANDTAGNLNNSVAALTITIDNLLPTARFTVLSSGVNYSSLSNRLIANLSGTGSNLSVMQLLVNGVFNSNFTLNASSNLHYVVWTEATDGLFNLSINVTDSASNTNVSNIVSGIRLDSTAPSLVFESAPASGSTSAGNLTINLTIADVGVGLQTALIKLSNGTILKTCSLGGASGSCYYSALLSDGSYTWNAVVNDSLSNTNTSANRVFTISNAGSNVTIVTPSNNSFNRVNTSVSVRTIDSNIISLVNAKLTNTSGGVVLNFNLTNSSAPINTTLWSANLSIIGFSDGNYTLTINTTNKLNVSNIETIVFNRDRTAPSISTFSLSTTVPLQSSSVTSTCTATDNSESFGGSVGTVVTGVSTTTLGTKTATCTATDSAGNTATSTVSYSVKSASLSGGGGGSSSTRIVTVQNNAPVNFVFDNFKIPVSNVEIEFSDKASNLDSVSVAIKEVKLLPATVPVLTGNYEYFEIAKKNFLDSDVGIAKISFLVSQDWIVENGLSADKIALYRFIEGDGWVELSTKVIRTEGKNILLLAESPGFSYFGIAKSSGNLVEVVPEPVIEKVTNPVVDPAITVPVEEVKSSDRVDVVEPPVIDTPYMNSKTLIWLAIILVFIVVFIYYFIRPKFAGKLKATRKIKK